MWTILFASSLAALAVSAAVAARRLSASTSRRLAEEYCTRIGQPLTARASAKYLTEYRQGGQVMHWQPFWRVAFGYEVTVHVVDASGDIALYRNLASRARADRRPPGPPMPDGDTIRRAEAALRASGGTSDLVFQRAEVRTGDAARPAWWVWWRRCIEGIPYRDQHAVVAMDAETGIVTTVSRTYRTPAPAPAEVLVTPERAAEVAAARLASIGRPQDVLVSIRAEVVQLNRFWEPGGSEMERLPSARVAWECRFYDSHNTCHQVWVDAENGSVVAGSVSRSPWLLPGESRPSPLRDALARAREVCVYRRNLDPGSLGLWPEQPAVVLGATQSADQLAVLKDHTDFRPIPIRQVPRWKLVIVGEGSAAVYEAEYHPETGALGALSHWGVVDYGFRDWLSEQTKQRPAAQVVSSTRPPRRWQHRGRGRSPPAAPCPSSLLRPEPLAELGDLVAEGAR